MAPYTKKAPLSKLSQMANWMIQDRDLWLCRRYEKLHIFNILSLQQHLAMLEQRLDKFDGLQSRAGDEQFATIECPPENPDNLVREIQTTVKAYDEALLALVEISRFKSPAVHTVKVVSQTAQHLSFKSLAYELGIDLEGTDPTDLLAMVTPAKSWFHAYIDKSERLRGLFAEKTQDKNLPFKYSESRIEKAEFVIISAALCLVQMLPIAALTLVQSRTWKLIIIFVLIVIVSLLTSLFANTARATNFGAVAAYSAIVVAFLGKT